MLSVFTPISSVEEDMPTCNLGHLFNSYTARLSSQEILSVPQETLREYQRLLIPAAVKSLSKADKAKARTIKAARERLYILALIDNSLHDMHNCVVAACNTLGELFNCYDGDLHRYAAGERIIQIASYIPGDEQEMAEYFSTEEWAEFQAEFEPAENGRLRVIYKDDEESLAPYTIKAQLAQYFASLHEHEHVETIGSASPEDFAYFTQEVSIYSEQHKTSHIVGDLGVYRRNAQGQSEKQSFAQRVENELNDELKDKRVANHFNQILRRMHFASGLAAMLTDAASCQELLDVLLSIRDCTDLYEPATLV